MQLSAKKLKQIRTDKGWSQDLLATATGLSIRTIQRIESDGRASAESVLAIASAFEISPTQLQPSNNEIEVNWTRKRIMQGLIVLSLILLTVISLFNTASEGLHYLDGPSLIFTFALTYLFTAFAFGMSGLKDSVSGLKYLFAQDIVGGKAALNLQKIYQHQIRFCYASALLLLLIGLVAIIRMYANQAGTEQWMETMEYSVPVMALSFLYATIFSEGILRPLKAKLEVSNLPQG